VIAVMLALGLLFQAAPAARTGIVSGIIRMPDGMPATGVRVAAIPAPPPDARPQDGSQYYEPPPPVRIGFTDDQGRYRLANIPPGRYLIAAGLVGQATYYPAATDALRASAVTIGPDAPASADFTVVTRIGGRVATARSKFARDCGVVGRHARGAGGVPGGTGRPVRVRPRTARHLPAQPVPIPARLWIATGGRA
jgi:hypothetical protein